MTITWQSLITASAVLAAVTAFMTLLFKIFDWFKTIKLLKAEIAALKDDQRILTTGVLACLKGLKEQGCNGPVTQAINDLEVHLNKKAHE